MRKYFFLEITEILAKQVWRQYFKVDPTTYNFSICLEREREGGEETFN
jgi:hypothetical protein